jgi:ATP synthase protein I
LINFLSKSCSCYSLLVNATGSIDLQMPKNEPDENGKREISDYAKYSAIGFQMIAIIGLFTYGGYRIDESAHHQTKWVTAVLALVGVFISMYVVISSLKKE